MLQDICRRLALPDKAPDTGAADNPQTAETGTTAAGKNGPALYPAVAGPIVAPLPARKNSIT